MQDSFCKVRSITAIFAVQETTVVQNYCYRSNILTFFSGATPFVKPAENCWAKSEWGAEFFLFSSARNKAPDTTLQGRLLLNG
jgi:hypothetical protein